MNGGSMESLLAKIGELVEREFQARAKFLVNDLVFDTDGQTVDQILARMRERVPDPGLLTLTLLEIAFRSVGPNNPVVVTFMRVGRDESGNDDVEITRRVEESAGDDGFGPQLIFDDGVLSIRLAVDVEGLAVDAGGVGEP